MTHRNYRNAFPIGEALEEISSGSGTKYDPEVVVACRRLFDEKDYTFDPEPHRNTNGGAG
jgi:HD-GYP domain-containing protein (c-di-GMP phosphodiesterase class II)